MFFGRYEIQVLDSFQNLTYADGQAAAIYGQYPPLGQRLAASRPVADLRHHLHGPSLQGGRIASESPAYVTMLHNGVLVHNHTPLFGADGVSGRRHLHAARAQGAHRPPGPRKPRAIPQHLGP